MSNTLSSRLKNPKRYELMKSHSQAQVLANKLRQDGVLSTVENVMQAVEQVAALLASNVGDNKLAYKDSVINLCQHLKVYGMYLEILFKEQLDHAFKIFRDKAQDDVQVEILSRLHLLELIELRAKGWKDTEGMNVYYKKKSNQCGASQADILDSITSMTGSVSSMISPSPPLLAAGEVITSSGKFAKPTRIPGKKYCKDEVVIRNADSGKVNPGAKERLVQITGANEESITHAKQLIEDTIRRNASPVREQSASMPSGLRGSSSSLASSTSEEAAAAGRAISPPAPGIRHLVHSLSTNDAAIGEYKYTVIANGCTIKITGDNLDLVRTSKLVLDEYFSGEPIHDASQFYIFDSLPQPILPEDFSSTNAPMPPPESSLFSQESYSGGEDENDNVEPRKPRLSAEDLLKNKSVVGEPTSNPPDCLNSETTVCTEGSKKDYFYSIEFLAHLAMSPLCLMQPDDWKRISNDHPTLVRSVVEKFDAKNYLYSRTVESNGVISADDIDPSDV
ncbi:unnamed protein product [Acanthoscelides obtectus]|uniref:Eukaryotic translation initiation factor 4E-binding protein Mextli n=1 Tax=Acanthoscelides obtectus TaxID=200917 RepID=A0A9P0PQ83_ACAOB|nr:unnamed protein product [Acanthoscelides obtectus]CAK1661224.1 Eukaryotic translation initiation factor 4E-binding protein Mextli [Acanthoscelides obtectus]